MHQPPKDLRQFQSLVEVMKALRSPNGCPWDLEQTHRTLTPYAIEEAHELAEAIESGDLRNTVEELGDLLLQVVFHAEIGRQENRFTIEDVIESINKKMVTRHPHVFGETQVTTSADVLENWGKIKSEEKKQKGTSTDPHDFQIPVSLPALQRAHKIGEKTHRLKFDWPNVAGVLEKLEEEIAEMKQALASQDPVHQEHEIGDVLFTVAQVARHMKLDAEQALRTTNARFERRYKKMMELAQKENINWSTILDRDKEEFWQKAKKITDK